MKRLLQQLGEKGSRYDPDALAYFNQLTGSLPASFKNAVNTYVRALKAAGIWTQLDRLWLHATPNQQNARISIVNPTSTPITEVNAPTWTANLGYTGDGATKYINTNFNTFTNGFYYTTNRASFGFYNQTIPQDGGYYGVFNGTNGAYIGRWAASARGRINSNLEEQVSPAFEAGLIALSRPSAISYYCFKNGISGPEIITASTLQASLEFYVLSLNNVGIASLFTNNVISLSFFGSGDINQSTFYTATQALAVAIGFNV